jgi:hypothetical protein
MFCLSRDLYIVVINVHICYSFQNLFTCFFFFLDFLIACFFMSIVLSVGLFPLLHRPPLLLNQHLDSPQALHIPSVFANVHAVCQRSLRLVEVAAADRQVVPAIVFVGGAEREVGFHFVVEWDIGADDES